MFVPEWRSTAAGERRQERQHRELPVERGERGAGEDRDDGRRVGEGPEDLPGRAEPAPDGLDRAQPPVVGERRAAGGDRTATARPRAAADARATSSRRRRDRRHPARRRRQVRVDRRGRDELVDLALLLEDRLEERQPEAGLDA